MDPPSTAQQRLLLLQEEAITDFQERLHQLWDKVNTAKPLPGTIEDLKYATAQLLTRLHQYPGVGLLMIPLLDMGNHRYRVLGPLPSSYCLCLRNASGDDHLCLREFDKLAGHVPQV